MAISTEKFNQLIFSRNTRIYAVLDGASVPDLPKKLFETKPPNFCLFTGELEPDMQSVAPYLVRLVPGAPFTDWVTSECWGRHWGIFIHSRQPIEKMRKHFRALVTVYNEQGNPMTFRFYDPRVLNAFLPTSDAEQLEKMFENIEYFFAESDDHESLISYNIEAGKLNSAESSVR